MIVRENPPNPPLRKGGKDRVPPFFKGGLGGIFLQPSLNSTALPLAVEGKGETFGNPATQGWRPALHMPLLRSFQETFRSTDSI